MSDKSEVRPIDANALCAILEAKADMALVPEYKHAFLNVQATVNAMPTIDAEPVRHGHWIKVLGGNGLVSTIRCSECDNCDNSYYIPGNYCWFCGAKMDGGKDDENA